MGEARRRQQTAARLRARMINEMANDGMSSRAIAKALGVSNTRVRHIAQRFGIPLQRRGQRRVAAWISDRRVDAISQLAERAGVSRAVMVERIVRSVIDDGVDIAARKLGKLALPRGA